MTKRMSDMRVQQTSEITWMNFCSR